MEEATRETYWIFFWYIAHGLRFATVTQGINEDWALFEVYASFITNLKSPMYALYFLSTIFSINNFIKDPLFDTVSFFR